MRKRRPDIGLVALCLCSVFLCQTAARPGEPVDEPVRRPAGVELDLRVYLMTSGYRNSTEHDPVVNPDNILEIDPAGLLNELNAQGKVVCCDRYLLGIDVSYQCASGYGERDTHWNTNEFFFDLFVNHRVYLKAGKKRESWSVGNVFSPLDIVNPPRNPLDPSKTREGAYLAGFEIPFGTSSLSFAYFPRVEYGPDDRDGIPGRMDFGNGGLGVRSYFLIRETDVALVYYRAERIPSLRKGYYGFTLNRFFGYLGTYVEVLGHEGRDVELVMTDNSGYYYFPDGHERARTGKADDHIYVDVSAGGDYTFSDNTRIGVEYLRSSEGYDDQEFDQLHRFFIHDSKYYGDQRFKNNLLRGADIVQERFRRDYIAFSFDRPNTLDDLFPRLNAVVSLDDGSFALSGLVDYLVRDDTSLKLVATRLVGGADTEYGLKPARGRVTVELTFYW
jgi:hypothetical protein